MENTGSGGIHGSQWKTRGLSEKHRQNIISPNNEFSLLDCEVEILLF